MKRQAFTLIELLIVIAILALLTSIMAPSLAAAKARARSVVCRSNIRQLLLANQNYLTVNDGYYVPAAPDIFDGFGGRRRWHGVREASSVDPDPLKNQFDPAEGPLSDSLYDVKKCPEAVDYVKEGSKNAFEASCGGYGYNSVGVGSRSYQYGYGERAMASSMRAEEIARPAETVMFSDTAYVQGFDRQYLIEYSFSEAPYFVFAGGGKIVETPGVVPSIHFRHLECANVVWCDGHATGEPFAFSILEEKTVDRFRIGWFGPNSNELFDPK